MIFSLPKKENYNLNIPLYLVAPDDRRHKVFEEVNRPTFTRLSPSLAEIVRFISFTKLQMEFEKILPFIKVIRPEFIETISESCIIEEVLKIYLGQPSTSDSSRHNFGRFSL